MTELEKIVRVVKKQLPDAPHEPLRVLDGTPLASDMTDVVHLLYAAHAEMPTFDASRTLIYFQQNPRTAPFFLAHRELILSDKMPLGGAGGRGAGVVGGGDAGHDRLHAPAAPRRQGPARAIRRARPAGGGLRLAALRRTRAPRRRWRL